MCGIVGVVARYNSGFFKQTEDSFFQMLYADALRGEDSTGVIAIEKDSRFHIAKEASSADYFASYFKANDDGKKVVSDMFSKGKAWVGHNRKKTIGEVSDDTAHPFLVENKFALVHNGTLFNHKKLADTAVDSHALAIHLQKAIATGQGDPAKVKAAIEESLAEVDGAYAVSMYDQDSHKLYLLRNKDRPLALIECENAVYFMSEALMGMWVLNRNGYATDKMKISAVQEHELITFHLDESNSKVMSREVITPKKKPTNFFQLPWETAQGKATEEVTNGLGQKCTVGGNNAEGVTFCTTQKQLSKFRKKFLGSRVTFWPDDLIEHDYPKTIAQGALKVTLMGGLEEVEYAHNLYASVDLGQLQLRFVEDVLNKKWTGIVDTIECDKSGYLRILLREDSCKPMVPSKVTTPQTNQQKEWKLTIQKQTTEELHTLYESLKFVAEDAWKMTEINRELAFRSSIHNIGEAVARAKLMENGAELKQVEREGKFLYLTEGPEGRIYYEAAVTLH